MEELIKSATKKTLSILKIANATITITPKVISIENINELEAKEIEKTFLKSGMKTLGVTNLEEIEMGTGFEISIIR